MSQSPAPLVDVGLIQVAVAITAVGFVIKQIGDTSPAIANTGGATFFLGGAISFMLYGVYLWDWIERNLQLHKKQSAPKRFYVALIAHIALLLLLLILVGVLGKLVPPPVMYR